MRRLGVLSVVFGFLLMCVPAAHGDEGETDPVTGSFAADDSGFTYTVTGLDEVEAIANATQGAAAGEAVVFQALIGNRVEERDVISQNLIQDSLQGNRGIVSVNQESGNLNNQANVRVIALAEPGAFLQDVELWGSATKTGNTLISNGGEREDRIEGSFGGGVGIIGVNQSSGNMNQQANVLVLAVGLVLGSEFAALGDSTLGEVSADNVLEGQPASSEDVIIDSFADFRGIAQVAQSSGDLNSAGNFLGVSLTVMDVR